MYKPIHRKFEKRKVHSSFKDNIWGTDLVDMQIIRFLLCDFDIFGKYAWVVPLWDRKGTRITNAFQKVNFSIDQWNLGQKKII